MKKEYSLTEGNILSTLMRFAVPILFTLFLQALYGGVDLLVVGRFAHTADVSGVSTGSGLTTTLSNIITGLSMGITVVVGEEIGKKKPEIAGKAIGSGICIFLIIAVLLTVFFVCCAEGIAEVFRAPEEAFSQTVNYIRICGAGIIFIVAYNVLGAVFRGIGDSKTPLITVTIACLVNIAGDLLFVAGFGMGSAGAAAATVLAQAISVILSLLLIRKKTLPFAFKRSYITFNRRLISKELRLGTPVALQEVFVGGSFMVIQMIVNTFGVTASAAVGVAEKVCAFIMLVPSAYMQSLSAFVAQNMGAGIMPRAKKALKYSVITAFAVGVVMFVILFTAGNYLAMIFSKDAEVVQEAHSYLKSYGIDCFISPMMFCFIGYFNGCEKTLFVMIQGFIGAVLVRVPVVYLVSQIPGVTLFQLGLGTPASSIVQILLCIGMYLYLEKKPSRIRQK